MNNIYIYDSDFNSLLNLINMLIKNNIRPNNIKNKDYQPNLFENTVFFKLDKKNIIDEYEMLLKHDNFKIIYYVYLSKNENKELIIFYYILNYLKYKEKTKYMRNLKCVCEALKIFKYVSREIHKLKGFVRFKELKNKILYAEIEPENNVLLMLSIHFKNRLKNEFWIIKDKKRRIISIYDNYDFYIFNENELNLKEINIADDEEKFENLWKAFYKNIGIKERKNNRARMNFMPKKYWKNIVEVKDEL